MMTDDPIMALYWGCMVFLLGAAIGSFLNVVIYRLPAGKSVVRPRSQCRCGAPIAAYDNIPVLSWLILRGRARCCGAKFSIRYPLVELSTALLFVGLWQVGGFPNGLVWMVFAGLMIPAALIDLDTMEIPDCFSIGGFICGLVLSAWVPAIHGIDPSGFALLDAIRGLVPALLGAFVGSGLVLWVALIAEVILRKEAMGFGDVKLMGAIGAFCGWQGAVFAFFGGAVLGMLAVLLVWPFARKRSKAANATTGEDQGANAGANTGAGGTPIPFGPALVAGALLYLLYCKPYVAAYFNQLSSVIHAF